MRLSLVVTVAATLASAAALTTGCAELTSECAGALLQATAQVCVDVLCDPKTYDGDDNSNDDDDADKPRTATREVPPPEWTPHEGACDVVEEDGGGVRVSCPDGTRAWFLSHGDPREIVEVEDAPPGSCKGARVLRQGIDVDGDGMLAAAEITGRTVDCPDDDGVRAPTLEGHLAIHGPDDVMRLSGRRALTGGLAVATGSLTRIDLPMLQSVGGTLRVDRAPLLERISMAHLAGVGGDVVIAREKMLTSVSMPMLSRVGGGLIFVENPRWPDADVQAVIERLSRHGYAGPVDLTGETTPVGTAPPAP